MKAKLIMVLLCLSVVGNANAISASYRSQLEKSGCTQVTDGNGTCDIHKSKRENMKHHHAELAPAERTIDQAVAGKKLSEVVPLLVANGWEQDDNAPLEFISKEGVRMILDVNQSNDQVQGVNLK
ncbi:hypothetical protein HV211_11500 [Citrobacter freundii]|uniref:hypothetical protein n=1 Tax=Citrobacter freundii TaxID=546 RepID=UPI0015EAF328|nr:hypothetical protein [Citrobacter freundii]QLY61073.1 hypothetical protein HV211_11500 [Citrobacter freundii]